ncbi:MAG: signal recognition particle-docking protein FtsY [Acidobacteria bacterium]|nr:MAG: signal recognition particle-docking protein FtsY [Acidobacteriota bacterium]
MVQTLFGPQEQKSNLFKRLKQAVASTKGQLVARLDQVTEGRETIDPALLDDLEATLIMADLGVETSSDILTGLREQTRRGSLKNASEIRGAVEQEILRILELPENAGSRVVPGKPAKGQPEVMLVVGVNGVGKTTSIAKLARYYKDQGRKPLLVAADTFRAAAIEQLDIWATRLEMQIVKQKAGADPSAVVFDGLKAARSGDFDPVIVDTAGRLHTKHNLMAELSKMCRIASREVPGAPHQVLLVIDATTGQNGLSQARQFTEHAGATGIILTKLDGTAKGGVVIAIARELALPIQFVGVGERIDDLIPFNPRDFVASLFGA